MNMIKLRIAFLFTSAFLSIQLLNAQSIQYPAAVSSIYNQADESIVLEKTNKPIIGIPAGAKQAEQIQAVREAGGVAVIIPQCEDASALRDLCSSLDGMVFAQGISANDVFRVLLHKATVERNIPFLGHNQLIEQVDSSLWRMHKYIATYPALIERARLFKRAKALHQTIFTIDTHADQPNQLKHGKSVGLRRVNQVNIQKMQEGGLDAVYLVNFQKQPKVTPETLAEGEALGKKIMQDIHADLAKYPNYCALARTAEEAYALKRQGKKAFFIGIENGHAIGDKLSNIEEYVRQGATYMTLCWSGDNYICGSCSSKRNLPAGMRNGLTSFGKKVVKEMNRCGLVIDCSHASDDTFWDCIKYSKAPFICSHSGARAVWNHKRSITDDMLRALAKKNGVIQVFCVWNFQSDNKYKACIENLLDHIDHCVQVAGIDHVGIGIDMDGGGGYSGIFGDNDMINITMGLLERHYTEEQIEKIWSKNYFRVLNEVQQQAKIKF